MNSLRSILAATDFSVDGNNAVHRAALLARQHGARLSILHVVTPAGSNPWRGWLWRSIDIDHESAQARATLRRFADEITSRHDVVAKVEVRIGDANAELLRASESVDLLVLGERGNNPFKDLLIGKAAHRLLRTCRTPVLVVKQAAQGPYRRVLVPIDFTPSSNTAIRSAASLAAGASIQFFHALSPKREAVLREADVPTDIIREYRSREEAGARARMRRGVARLGLDSRSTSFALGRGPVVQSTLLQAQALDADLIVAGKQRRSKVAGFFLGSVGSRLLAASRCDTVIVPNPLREPQSSSAADRNAVIETASLHRGAAALADALTSAQAPATTKHGRQSSQRRPAWAAVARLYP